MNCDKSVVAMATNEIIKRKRWWREGGGRGQRNDISTDVKDQLRDYLNPGGCNPLCWLLTCSFGGKL